MTHTFGIVSHLTQALKINIYPFRRWIFGVFSINDRSWYWSLRKKNGGFRIKVIKLRHLEEWHNTLFQFIIPWPCALQTYMKYFLQLPLNSFLLCPTFNRIQQTLFSNINGTTKCFPSKIHAFSYWTSYCADCTNGSVLHVLREAADLIVEDGHK